MAWYNDVYDAGKGFKEDYLDKLNVIGDPGGLGHIKDGPLKGDTSAIDQSFQDARNQAGAFGVERAGAQPTIDPAQTMQLRQQQLTALGGLTDAAAGKVPSAAELQAEKMRQANVGNQYAAAAALRGRSPGAALAQASRGAALINSQTAANGAQLRAGEQANARGQLVQALGGVRGQDINVAGQDQDWRKALLGAQVASTGQEATAAGTYAKLLQDQADAKNKSEGAWRQMFASMIGG